MVYRVYVEKQEALANEANDLLNYAKDLLKIDGLNKVRLLNRYDAENIDKDLFTYAETTVFSEPQVDCISHELPSDADALFCVESLPGQFDQRADSAAQCIQIISQGNRPLVRSAKVYALYGDIAEADLAAIKRYVINPVEAREASLEIPETLETQFEIPTTVAALEGFTKLDEEGLTSFIKSYGLAMDLGDITFCRDYFALEGRCPTITEIRMIDTYWSDHCRHTTFNTEISSVHFEDELIQETYEQYLKTRDELCRTKPICLMDIATLSVKALRAQGKLEKLDESEEINACTVKIDVEIEGNSEPWLLLFKNETHNHPTEIEPFGGAATCVGGAIRDPLSGRAYVYAAMRLTGAADPLTPLEETLTGKLPQRSIVTKAAAGYSSYGNQIGLTTGMVDEIYHPGFVAKRMEVGAVIGAAPAANVRRERPEAGDVIILLGGDTGRDGIGGATGSSKAHTATSVETCGAEVQKGNAPEERKIQRLFRNTQACRMIKRCNDFGAGGVSVAIGELADGLDINLNAVPKKYEGLDGTELAISESQERMAVCVEAKDADAFLSLAEAENLQACIVATVTDTNRLVMNWNGTKIVDISRDFLNSNGAPKTTEIYVDAPALKAKPIPSSFEAGYQALVKDLNTCSRRGLSERFDSTIGAGSVLMPFGGKNQQTPIQAMVHKIAVETKDTSTVSLMSWGYNPYLSSMSPYHGAYLAVVESVSKLIATGAKFEDVYLSFQEYFEKLGTDPHRWGKPLAAILGGFKAQMDLGIGCIGGKDSMSGSFDDLDVPPTLISFAVTTDNINSIVSQEFKTAGNQVICISPQYNETTQLPKPESLLAVFDYVTDLLRDRKALSCYTPTLGGVADAVFKMCLGNNIGFAYDEALNLNEIFGYNYGCFVLELAEANSSEANNPQVIITPLGKTLEDENLRYKDTSLELNSLQKNYEDKLESVFACNISTPQVAAETLTPITFEADCWPKPAILSARPKVLIPVFPGTNCEYDSAKAVARAGAEPEIFVIKNRSSHAIAQSITSFASKVADAQMIFIPGGFSGGDEPDGSGKFITAFFRNAAIKEAVTDLLNNRDGLICGICNGFQALIKLGLVPYGKIIDTDENCPTLTFNTIARHQSRIVRTRIASNKSPWLALMEPGDIVSAPISHGEGRFLASEELIAQLIANGQVATQYVDLQGNPSMDVHFNPNGSLYAIEGITSPDGRVFGKMGHAERISAGIYKNVPGNYDNHMFEAAVQYFK